MLVCTLIDAVYKVLSPWRSMSLLKVCNHVDRSLTLLSLRTGLNRDRPATGAGKIHTLLENQLTSIHVGDTRAAQDVVAVHRQRNRAPRLPHTSQLKTIRQQQSSLPLRSHEATNTSILDVQEDPELTASAAPPLHSRVGDRREVSSQSTQPRAGPTMERSECSEPWQIQFYEPAVWDILERAKQFSRCDASSVNAFPLRAQFNVKAAEYVEEAISERQSQALFVPDGMISCTEYSSYPYFSQAGGLNIVMIYANW